VDRPGERGHDDDQQQAQHRTAGQPLRLAAGQEPGEHQEPEQRERPDDVELLLDRQ
jgi:hypothetical protein